MNVGTCAILDDLISFVASINSLDPLRMHATYSSHS